ncbi:recombinase family protein [Methylocapsa aurea]|uniref:recombinase family protein n=1 Tax=Methylocapsa aurea TaxID=663610 RepID=UPI00055F435E|nr:recombinase family protein [Methylocapsa aurea]
MTKIGYLRVSTQEQRPDRQIEGLRNRCDYLYMETLSAVSPRRPIFETVIERLGPGDTLVVWDLDRAFRSVLDAVTQAERLRQKGIEFQIANLEIDTATPAGMLVYTVMSAFAEFERRLLVQRTKEGLAAARRRGTRLGRPPKLDDAQLDQARQRLSSENETTASIAKEFGVAPWTLTRSLRRQCAKPLPLGP